MRSSLPLKFANLTPMLKCLQNLAKPLPCLEDDHLLANKSMVIHQGDNVEKKENRKIYMHHTLLNILIGCVIFESTVK